MHNRAFNQVCRPALDTLTYYMRRALVMCRAPYGPRQPRGLPRRPFAQLHLLLPVALARDAPPLPNQRYNVPPWMGAFERTPPVVRRGIERELPECERARLMRRWRARRVVGAEPLA